jgi:hypothetical protein
MIEIYWKDITEEKQQEISEAFSGNCDYDRAPICTIPVYTKEKSIFALSRKLLGIATMSVEL